MLPAKFDKNHKNKWSRDPKHWTGLRLAHYEYFKKNLPPADKSKKLVDLGTGTLRFKDLFFQYDYVGVDFKEFEFVSKVADITKPLEFSDNFCEIVTLSNTLEHVPNPQEVLKEVYRILKPGGILVGSVPFLIRLHQEPYDFYRYTNFALDYLLKNAGFLKIEVENIGPPFYVYKETQDYFFDVFLRSKPGGLAKYFYVLFVKFSFWQTRFFGKFLARTVLDDAFPMGYGFCATKEK